MAVDYVALLEDKVQAEYDAFLEELKQLPAEQVIEKAYQKVLKEDLVAGVEISNLTQSEAKAIYREKNSLEYLYQEWMDSDHSYMDILRDSIDDAAKKAVKEMKDKQRESR